MKIISIILVVLIYSLSLGYVFPQSNPILDSLKHVLKTSEESGDSLNIARANFKIGRYYSYNDLEKSYKHLNRALLYAKAIKYDKAIGLISNILASNYSDQGRHEEALELYNDILEYFNDAENLYIKATVLMNIGLELSMIGRYSNAIEKQLSALDLLIESGDSANIANFYCEIGILFNKIGNKSKHNEYLNTAYKLSENEYYSNFYTRINIINELAYLHQSNNDYDIAFDLFHNVYIESLEQNFVNGASVALKNMAAIEKERGKYLNAKSYLLESQKLNKETDKLSHQITVYSELGEVTFLLNDFVNAEIYLLKAVDLAEENQYPEELKKAHRFLYQMYYDKSNYKKALVHQTKYISIQDSLENLSVKEQFAEMETRFNVQQKEKTIELLNKENTLKSEQLKNQFYLWGGITLTLLFGGLFILGYVRNKKTKAELEALQYKQSMLRSQLNPHFIFNSLNAIQNFILKNKSFESADYLSDFARLMRLILESSREDLIPLENEVTLITNYLKLQQLRFENNFTYSINIDDSLDIENLLVPGMLLQPFVENSIEHGLKDCTNGEGKITVEIYKSVNKLYIQMSDNGTGINKFAASSSHTSYSTKITEERIENLLKFNNTKITFDILNNEGCGTKVIFIIENLKESNL